MEVLDQILRFVNVSTAALMSGGQLLVLMVIVPVKREWTIPLSVRVHQAMLHTLPDRYLLPSGIVSGITAVAILVIHRDLNALIVVLYLAGLLGSVGVAVTSERFNKPMNRIILGWTEADIPPTYPEMRDRWDRVHAVRTLSGLLALVCYLIAALAP